MTNAEMKANRLATIHKDLCDVTAAVTGAARDITMQGLTIKAASEKRHTAEVDKKAEQLDRMTIDTTDLGHGLRNAIRTVLDVYASQRDNCKRNKAQFVNKAAIIEGITADGMFQDLIALRKAAKAELQAKQAVEAAPVVVEQVDPAPVFVQQTPELLAMARDSKQGLEVRITKLSNALSTLSEEDLERFLIVSPLVAVAYGLIDGRYASHTDLAIAPGFQTEREALEVAGPNHVVKTRRDVLTEALMSSKEAHSKMTEWLAQAPAPVTQELKPSNAWLQQQAREGGQS